MLLCETRRGDGDRETERSHRGDINMQGDGWERLTLAH